MYLLDSDLLGSYPVNLIAKLDQLNNIELTEGSNLNQLALHLNYVRVA